jgi:hypothetical protein
LSLLISFSANCTARGVCDADTAALFELFQPELVSHLELLAFRRQRTGEGKRRADRDFIGSQCRPAGNKHDAGSGCRS